MIKVVLISIAIAALGFFPLMGLPGVWVLMLSKPGVYLMYGPMAFEAFEHSLGASSWALLIMLSLLWPISIPVAYGLSKKLFGKLPFFSIEQLIPFCVFVLLGATIISSLAVLTNPSLKRLSESEVLEQALRKGKLSLVEKLWNSKDNDQQSFGDPLFVALENKQTKVVHYLLDNGVNPQKYSKDFNHYEPGITPLHTATKKRMVLTMEKLLKLGVDPNIRSTNGRVPLHDLGEMNKKSLNVIELLKTYEADFAAVDNDGNTPLISMMMVIAPLKHRPILAQKLIDYGCLKDLKNKRGQTALDIIQEHQASELELIRILSDETQ